MSEKMPLLTLQQTAIYFLKLNNTNTVPQRQSRTRSRTEVPARDPTNARLGAASQFDYAQDDTGGYCVILSHCNMLYLGALSRRQHPNIKKEWS